MKPKNSSSRVISFDYKIKDDGKYLSTYPEERSKPIVYEPMNDRAGLEDIEMDVYDLWNQADGYYFITRNGERSELIFFTMSGDGKGKTTSHFPISPHNHVLIYSFAQLTLYVGVLV